MFLSELTEPRLLVIYPGRFQPFHKGHFWVYQYLVSKFGRNNVYIVTSNKVEPPKSPFPFSEKSYFMQLTGVPADRIVQASQPYSIKSIIDTGRLQVSDPANTVAIFAVSEKDMQDDPRFSFEPKKDGSPGYYQPLKNIRDTENMDHHGYVLTVPTHDFTVLGQPMRSGTQLRDLYADSDNRQRHLIISELFGRYTREAEQYMSRLIPAKSTEPDKLPNKTKLEPVPKAKPVDYTDYEFSSESQLAEAGGVGVVKGSKDPRYSMATTGDQNAVTGATLGKEMRAFGLAGRSAPRAREQRPVRSGIGRGGKAY